VTADERDERNQIRELRVEGLARIQADQLIQEIDPVSTESARDEARGLLSGLTIFRGRE